jgi:uncharacterized NAD(P)/FAD-binding protein YdhS
MIARMAAARVVIVGGGYSGAATAVQLARASKRDISITIVEPRAELGRGLAYSTLDPDHRLNGPLDNHLVDPNAPDEMLRWCAAHGIFERDPEVRAANGALYVRRGDFGAHVGDVVRATPGIRHHRSLATALRNLAAGYEVLTGETRIGADLVIVATGNGTSSFPEAFAALASHPALIADPFDAERLRSIPSAARVLLVGGGLTALDVASTLLRAGHRGRIAAFSRHGVRPRPPRERLPEGSTSGLMDRIDGDMPAYAAAVLASGGIVELSRALRQRIDEARARGEPWQLPFDELRNSVWRIWPRLAVDEKRRFLRHLRTWYDAHRFRTPPQNAAMAAMAERDGRLVYPTGRIHAARDLGSEGIGVAWTDRAGSKAEGRFDVVVNCTGLDPACGAASNPFLADLVSQGYIRPDPTGFGFEVDAECRPIGKAGAPSPKLRIVGPPTAGTFGDPLGVPFIAPQIRRMLPGLLAELR